VKYKLVTFDLYAALVDLEGSLVPELEKVIGKTDQDLVTVFRNWRASQGYFLLINNSLAELQRDYDSLTMMCLEYALQKASLVVSQAGKRELVDAWTRLRLWPEAKSVLVEVKRRGYPIGILSNGDTKMIAKVQEGFGVTFDHIFAADQAGAFKPSPNVYALPVTKLNLNRQEILHVAGTVHDFIGAKAAGIVCAWSNRAGDAILDPKYAPDYITTDLTGVLDLV
jgi:2-haloacid dehalogenase